MKNLAFILFAVSLVACNKEKNLEVKQVTEMETGNKINIQVANAEDPICNMKTAEHLSDTLTYKGEVYGFCGPMCKEEFKKNPDSYLK
ncbi:YHS domain-containing protein [Chryseobacterium sp. POL2]|uniref:YHS domain-containing protein n=1 Tax=Chryseobacterium sp. POL2 TaxID=2713414 RepID=UPI0013E1CC1B|nr:YHS domain-containing protein [Chryseobacterium sp. POL2]QIG89169.1 YHS domain-containing protein [Chryseobacterium sp. POL2]